MSKLVGSTTKEKIRQLLVGLSRYGPVRYGYMLLRRIPGVNWIVQGFVRTVLPMGSRVWIKIPDGLAKGMWFCVDPRYEPGYIHGDHEPWLQKLLQKKLKPGSCFYDVGAHTGFFSLIAAMLVRPSKSVIAFEPDPEVAMTLRENIARNGITQVKIVETGVWSFVGSLKFSRASQFSNQTQGYIVGSSEHAKGESVSISVITLDEFVMACNEQSPDFIKLDVEGGEWEALKGAQRLLREVRPDLFCEIHDRSMVGRIKVFLSEIGYVVEVWDPIHPRYPDYRQCYIWATVPRQLGS